MDERIVVIDDTRELRLNRRNLLAAECQTNAHIGTVKFNDLLTPAHPSEVRVGNPYGLLMSSDWNQQLEGMRNSYEFWEFL